MASKDLVSFDIFDTLITRRTLRPEDVFLLVGDKLQKMRLITLEEEDWAAARKAAEWRARKLRDHSEVTLSDIYKLLGEQFQWSDDQASVAKAIEVDLEYNLSTGINEIISRHAGTGQSVLISDTYFCRATILKLLGKHQISVAPGRLFVSSESGLQKRDRGLYREAASRLAPLSWITHLGDNYRVDVVQARRSGIRGIHYRGSVPSRYEELLYSEIDAKKSVRSLLAGSIRSARLSYPGGSEVERTIWQVGTNVAAPLLFSYVCWILAEAGKKSITKLFFLARDGEILVRIASIVAPLLGSSVTCEYIYASRQSWHLPSTFSFDRHFVDWFLTDAEQYSIRTILGRVEIDPEEIDDLLLKAGFGREQWGARLGKRSEELLMFLKEKKFSSLVLRRAKVRREALLEYLKQKGLMESGRIGIVDVGWHGRLQLSLSQLLDNWKPGDSRRIVGFYLGLNSVPAEIDHERALAFLSTPRRAGAKDVVLTKNGTVLEMFFAASHGSVAGFAFEGVVGARAMLASEKNDEALRWGLDVQHNAILTSVKSIVEVAKFASLELPTLAEILIRPAAKCLALFAEWPTGTEADAYGSYPHSVDQKHATFMEMAPSMSIREMLSSILKLARKKPTPWPEGALRRSLPRLVGTLAIWIQRIYKHG